MSKYRAVRTSCGVHEHASKREAKRCGELQIMEKMGEIADLVQQPVFDLNGIKYRADWKYAEPALDTPDGWTTVVEDCKGFKTDVYKLKKRLMKSIYGVEIRET